MTNQDKREGRAEDSGQRPARRVETSNGGPDRGAAAAFVGSGVYIVRGSASSAEGVEVWGRGNERLRLRQFDSHGQTLIDAAIYKPTASGDRYVRDEVKGLTLPVEVWEILLAEVEALIDADEEAGEVYQ